MVSKEKLKQYNDLKLEVEKLKAQKLDIENKIAKLIEEGTVKDKVYGGEGGRQGFVIEGFPQKEYDRRRAILRKKNDKLIERETDLEELIFDIENDIDEIPDSRTRIIFKGIYLEGKTQQEVANELHYDRSLISKIINA